MISSSLFWKAPAVNAIQARARPGWVRDEWRSVGGRVATVLTSVSGEYGQQKNPGKRTRNAQVHRRMQQGSSSTKAHPGT